MSEIFVAAVFTIGKQLKTAMSAEVSYILNQAIFGRADREFPFFEDKIFATRGTKVVFQGFFCYL
jgi:hypothetical protein